jgi:orotate phosphoribosyltransferase-like protein
MLDPKEAPKAVKDMAKMLKMERVKFDMIVGQGNSGVLGGVLLSVEMKKPMVIVRKKSEKTHGSLIEHSNVMESHTKGKVFQECRYIIVDDGIDTGKTITRINDTIRKYCKENSWTPPECVGVILYDQRAISGDTDIDGVHTDKGWDFPVYDVHNHTKYEGCDWS